MKPAVTVVDYGVGNLLSVARALEHCGAAVSFAASPEDIDKAALLLLPGVGAFGDGIGELRSRGLDRPVVRYAQSGRPLLGICLGMQFLLETSEEFGEHAGLALVPGRVCAIPGTGTDGRAHKIPHIGWSGLQRPAERETWSGTILDGVAPGAKVYFVHTYTAHPAPQARLADCDYHGRRISAAIQRGAVAGCQFHPEKSGETGLQVLRNFLRMG
ncbi:MAG TPA: imidazole glycerol phosphate synthase subunit HisH [Burkholderiales bacterium]|nr:imidazole glycerol phosphate synthase subunit HisH [Burkholderiales bacterium]